MKAILNTLKIIFVIFYALVKAVPEIKRHERMRKAEQVTLEVAPWIGQTGLDEETERELPRYLRREFGEFLQEGGLKAADLEYVGKFCEDSGEVHYWRIPYKDGTPTFAYVEVHQNGEATALGWGDKAPTGTRIAY